jgi:hypothetical protein
MKIYLAGNTPDRIKEERLFRKNGIDPPRRLVAFHYLLIDKSVMEMFKYFAKMIK